MFKKPSYSILIENFLIGTTEFEFADVPMGIAYGKLLFTDLKSPYSFLNNYCFSSLIFL